MNLLAKLMGIKPQTRTERIQEMLDAKEKALDVFVQARNILLTTNSDIVQEVNAITHEIDALEALSDELNDAFNANTETIRKLTELVK